MRGFGDYTRLVARAMMPSAQKPLIKCPALWVADAGILMLERIAREGDPHFISFAYQTWSHHNDFPIPVRKPPVQLSLNIRKYVADVAASFQRAAIEQLCGVVTRPATTSSRDTGRGGVAQWCTTQGAGRCGTKRERGLCRTKFLRTDNAAMIVGYYRFGQQPSSTCQVFELKPIRCRWLRITREPELEVTFYTPQPRIL